MWERQRTQTLMPQFVHVSNNNWHTAGKILDDIFVFHHLGIIV